jgi:hypothetical protein
MTSPAPQCHWIQPVGGLNSATRKSYVVDAEFTGERDGTHDVFRGAPWILNAGLFSFFLFFLKPLSVSIVFYWACPSVVRLLSERDDVSTAQ